MMGNESFTSCDRLPPTEKTLYNSLGGKCGIINIISNGFAEGESNKVKEVYAMQISPNVQLGKRPKLAEDVLISLLGVWGVPHHAPPP